MRDFSRGRDGGLGFWEGSGDYIFVVGYWGLGDRGIIISLRLFVRVCFFYFKVEVRG